MAQDPKDDAGRGSDVKTLMKGLAIVDLLLSRSSLRTSEAATAIDIDKSGASRMMQTLVKAGFACRDSARGFRLGPKLTSRHVSRRPKRSLRERARPIIEGLAKLTRESIHLAIPADEHVFYIDAIEANFPLRVDSRPGTLGPVDCTAMGRIFIAYGILAMPAHLEAHTEKTITDPIRFEEELQTIRAQGYAMQNEEYYVGTRGVAAPLFDPDGFVIGTVGISGPSVRIDAASLPSLGALARDWALRLPIE
jgi:DNA-binding IclR family transcriptional regulator